MLEEVLQNGAKISKQDAKMVPKLLQIRSRIGSGAPLAPLGASWSSFRRLLALSWRRLAPLGRCETNLERFLSPKSNGTRQAGGAGGRGFR